MVAFRDYHLHFLFAFISDAPSPELVKRVRDLYQKRVSDVRFLIPVLTGLTKVCLKYFFVISFYIEYVCPRSSFDKRVI